MPKGIQGFQKGQSSVRKGKKFPSLCGKGNFNWKGGPFKCIDCGKVSEGRRSIRCLSCASKEVSNRPDVKSVFKSLHIEHHASHYKDGITKDPNHIRRRNRINSQKYKANKRGAGILLKSTIQLVYEDNIKRYGTLTCIYCLKPTIFGDDTLEHKLPITRGGTNEYSNLAIACKSCNSRKRDKTVEEFNQKEQEKNA